MAESITDRLPTGGNRLGVAIVLGLALVVAATVGVFLFGVDQQSAPEPTLAVDQSAENHSITCIARAYVCGGNPTGTRRLAQVQFRASGGETIDRRNVFIETRFERDGVVHEGNWTTDSPEMTGYGMGIANPAAASETSPDELNNVTDPLWNRPDSAAIGAGDAVTVRYHVQRTRYSIVPQLQKLVDGDMQCEVASLGTMWGAGVTSSGPIAQFGDSRDGGTPANRGGCPDFLHGNGNRIGGRRAIGKDGDFLDRGDHVAVVFSPPGTYDRTVLRNVTVEHDTSDWVLRETNGNSELLRRN